MPKYYEFKVCGYYLYYTSSCVIEAMHVHASDLILHFILYDSIKQFIIKTTNRSLSKSNTTEK